MTFFPCRNWKPSPAVLLSLAVLAVCILLTVRDPALWPWTLGIVFANRIVLVIAGLTPRSTLLGPNITRLPEAAAQRGEVAITIDDGPDPVVTPQVLDLLDRHGAKATFFCIGKLAAQYPELCRQIVQRGHAIENHTFSHFWFFSLLDPWTLHHELCKAQQVLAAITGSKPRFLRAVAGLRNPELDPVLAHTGLRLCSWSARGFDTQVSDADAVLRSLTRELKGGDILLLHDGSAACTAAGTPVILEVLPRLLDTLAQSRLRSVTLTQAIPS